MLIGERIRDEERERDVCAQSSADSLCERKDRRVVDVAARLRQYLPVSTSGAGKKL